MRRVLLAVALLAAAAAARADEPLAREKTKVYSIEAPPPIAADLAHAVRSMEAMVERTKIGKKPKERRIVIARSAAECPEIEDDQGMARFLQPGAVPAVVVDEFREFVARDLIRFWCCGGGRSPHAGLEWYVRGFEPPESGEKLPRANAYGRGVLELLTRHDRGPFKIEDEPDPYVSFALVTFALECGTPEAKKVRGRLEAALRAAAKEPKPGAKPAAPVTLAPPRADREKVGAAVLAFIRSGEGDPTAVRGAYVAALRRLYEGRLGAAWVEPAAPAAPPAGSRGWPDEAVSLARAVHDAAKPALPWLDAGLSQAVVPAPFWLGRIEVAALPSIFKKAREARAFGQGVALAKLVELPAAAFKGAAGVFPADATATAFAAFLLAQPDPIPRAVFADPTAAGIEKAFGKPLAEVDTAFDAFAEARKGS